MNTEDFAFNDGANSQVVEHLAAVLPGVDITILAHGFLVETIHRGDTARLVIASQERDAVRVLQLEAKEELEGLDRVVATIDKVTHEDVASVWNLATFFK